MAVFDVLIDQKEKKEDKKSIATAFPEVETFKVFLKCTDRCSARQAWERMCHGKLHFFEATFTVTPGLNKMRFSSISNDPPHTQVPIPLFLWPLHNGQSVSLRVTHINLNLILQTHYAKARHWRKENVNGGRTSVVIPSWHEAIFARQLDLLLAKLSVAPTELVILIGYTCMCPQKTREKKTWDMDHGDARKRLLC